MLTRGPDGAGIWMAEDGKAILGHRRLAIIDLSDAAAQPMLTEDRRFCVTFNGEIYNHAELKKELIGHLRTRRTLRHSRRAGAQDELRGRIPDAVSIRERPAEVEDRAIPGHWEGDMISGSKNSHIVTLVERHSRYTALVKVQNKETATVVTALTRQIRRLPTSLRRSLTWDRGHEMSKHEAFTVATNVKVYFCDPSSPWQRGSNENTNGLLRQYFRKGTDLSEYSQSDLDKVALRLNQRPRETLGFQTPAAKLSDSVALTR
jgi:IS30 family transposase